MKLIMTKTQRAKANATRRQEYKNQVIRHARSKLVFSSYTSEQEFLSVADIVFEKVDQFLDVYSEATYESYVLMMLVYFLRGIEAVEGPDMQATLQNPRFGINTRVRVAYDLARVFLREGV